MTIRPVRRNELERLIQLCKEHAEYEKSEYSPLHKKEALEEHIFGETQAIECLVVESEQKLVGYASFMKQFSTWEAKFYVYMDCLYLDANHRNQGIGKHLLDEIRNFALREDCTEIQWQTPIFNEKAIKFYEREGAYSKSKARFFLNIKNS
ncbi:MAG: GNAT family N-acetyltransferase [Bacteroidota bacterium]